MSDILTSEAYICDVCAFEAKTGAGLTAHKRIKHEGYRPGLRKASADSPVSESAEASIVPDIEPEEVEPAGWRQKLWGAVAKTQKAEDKPTKEKVPKERKPAIYRRRLDTTDFWSGFYGAIGGGLRMTGIDVPAGRVMEFQAEVAGPIIEKRIKGTALDKILQPWIARADDTQDVLMLFLLPILCSRAWRHPQEAQVLEPLAKACIRRNLIAMGPVVKRKKAEEKKFAEAVAELGLPPGEDPVQAIWEAIFAPPEGQPEQPSANGQVADAGAAVTP